MGWTVARGTTAVNRGQKGIRASETERNRVFVALLPGSPRLGPPLSARVCPAQTLFLQIEPHVPPFTLSTHSLFTYPPFHLPSAFRVSPPPSFLSFLPLPSHSPPPVRHSLSLSLSRSLPPPSSRPSFARLHGTDTPLRTHATGGKV